MNTSLSYAPDVKKVGFADIENIQFANTLNLSVEQQKDIYFTAANRCRGSFIPTWANENIFFPSKTPPEKCEDKNNVLVTVTDLNAHPINNNGNNTKVVGNNVQDLTYPPNKEDRLNINKKDILIFVMIGAGIFVISKILS